MMSTIDRDPQSTAPTPNQNIAGFEVDDVAASTRAAQARALTSATVAAGAADGRTATSSRVALVGPSSVTV